MTLASPPFDPELRTLLADVPLVPELNREVLAHVSPATAGDLSGLPDTYIDAGTAEVFRDEAVTYASRIWAAGGQAELHIWAGGFHGFDALYPQARLSAAARRTRNDWLARILALAAGPARPQTSGQGAGR